MPRSSIPGTVVGLLALLASWAAYHYELVSEVVAGRVFLLAILAAACGASLWPRIVRARSVLARGTLVLFGLLWIFGVGYEPLHVAFPSTLVGRAVLPTPDGALQTSIAAPDGACELLVAGRLKTEAQTHAVYQLEVDGEPAPIFGRFERVFYRARGRRRIVRGIQTIERTENVHRLAQACGSSVSVALRQLPEVLDGPMVIEVHRAGLRPTIPLAAGILTLMLALVIDRRRGESEIPLAYAVAVTLVFSIDFPAEATPHRIVGPALGAALLAVISGVPAGWMLSRIVGRSEASRAGA